MGGLALLTLALATAFDDVAKATAEEGNFLRVAIWLLMRA
jgi:hypothetical protein